MERNDIDLLKKVLSTPKTIKEPTFLGIIQREDDEDLVSRYLGFVLSKHPETILKMMSLYNRWSGRKSESLGSHLTVTNFVCEKIMLGQKRADIFIKVQDESGTDSIILIENKIGAEEHDLQTTNYATWGKELSGSLKENVFYFYLFPENQPKEEPSSKDFCPITYKQLDDILDGGDQFVLDFKKYTRQNLEETNMDERDKVVVENFEEIDDAMKKVLRRRSDFFSDLEGVISNELPRLITYQREENINYEYYEKEWDSTIDECKFYLYVAVFMEGGDPNKLFVCKGIKKYQKSNGDLLETFIRDQKDSQFSKDSAAVFVSDKTQFHSSSNFTPLSFEWEKEADAFVVAMFKKYIPKQESTFSDLKNWLDGHVSK